MNYFAIRYILEENKLLLQNKYVVVHISCVMVSSHQKGFRSGEHKIGE